MSIKKCSRPRGLNSWGFDDRVRFNNPKKRQGKDKVVDSGKIVKSNSDTFIELNVKNSDKKVKINVTPLTEDKHLANVTYNDNTSMLVFTMVDGNGKTEIKEIDTTKFNKNMLSVGEGLVMSKTGVISVGEPLINKINKNESDIALVDEKIGVLDNLSTTEKTNIVSAINEVASSTKQLKVDYVTESKVDVVKLETAEDGFAASYQIHQNGKQVGKTINIPKDLVVSSGSVVTNPDGQKTGTYLKLVLANSEAIPIFIPVNDLIEYVTSGSKDSDSVVIKIDGDNKVTATITDGTISEDKLDSKLKGKINKEVKFPTYTVNGKNLKDGENTVISASDIALTGYTKDANNKYDDIVETDDVKSALVKVMKSLSSVASVDDVLGLDYPDSPIKGQFVTSVSQEDGKITVTRASVPVATTTSDGLMSSVDKEKLDSIKAATTEEINAIINS